MGEHLLGKNTISGATDSPAPGIAGGTWRICRYILLAAPEFSGELKAWAEISAENVGWDEADGLPNEHISVIRQWWNQNRAAFHAGEFSKVKPGGILASWQEAADRMAALKHGRTNPVPAIEVESGPKPPAEVAPSVPETPLMPTGKHEMYAAIAALVLAAALVFRGAFSIKGDA